MVLESLFNPFTVKKKPHQMFLAGALYTFVGIALSYFVFREIASILSVFLIVLATLPLLYITIKNEEELDLKQLKEWRILKEHTKVLVFLMFFFFGVVAMFVVSYIFLPQDVTGSIFSLQEQAILNVNSNVQGQTTNSIDKISHFSKIVLNNLKVMFFCLIFSLLYGTGAIFILTWNASVISAAIGNFARNEIAYTASKAGFSAISTYFAATSLGFFRYMTHGFFEIAAYFIAGLAGGIISIALIKHNLKNEKVFMDALDLILISLGVLLFAGFVEVYITPYFF